MRRQEPPRNKSRRKCPTKKIRFRDEHDANRSLAHYDNPDREEHPVRAYPCPKCKGWHLTKVPWNPRRNRDREIPDPGDDRAVEPGGDLREMA